MENKYSEHEKLKKVENESQAIGEFLEWLEQEEIVLAEYNKDPNGFPLIPHWYNISSILAKFLNIDEKKLEEEKLQMLEEIRNSK